MLAISVLVFPAADVISAFPLHAVTLGNNLITLTTLEDVESSRNPAPGTPTSPNEAEAMDNGMSNDPAEGQSTEGATPTTIAIRLSTAQGSGGSEEAPYFSTGFETAADAPTSTPRHRHSCCDRNKSCGANFRACLSAAVRTPRRRKVLFRLLAAIPPIVGAAFVSSLDEILHFTGLVGVFIAFIIPPWLWRASQRGCIEVSGGDSSSVLLPSLSFPPASSFRASAILAYYAVFIPLFGVCSLSSAVCAAVGRSAALLLRIAGSSDCPWHFRAEFSCYNA